MNNNLSNNDLIDFIKSANEFALAQQQQIDNLKAELENKNKIIQTLNSQIENLSKNTKSASDKTIENYISDEDATRILNKMANINLSSSEDFDLNKSSLQKNYKIAYALSERLLDKIANDQLLNQGSLIEDPNNVNLTSKASNKYIQEFFNNQYKEELEFLSAFR